MALFLTSDYHLGHWNIVDYASRPFKTLEQHDNSIIRLHNERISDNDFFIHNGDFNFRNSPGGKEGEGVTTKGETYASRLKGKGLFINGNHEKSNARLSYVKSAVVDWGGKEYFVAHSPEDANPDFPVNFVGHVHNKWRFRRILVEDIPIDLINVGIDVTNYMPFKIEEHLKEYLRWKKSREYKDWNPDPNGLLYLKS